MTRKEHLFDISRLNNQELLDFLCSTPLSSPKNERDADYLKLCPLILQKMNLKRAFIDWTHCITIIWSGSFHLYAYDVLGRKISSWIVIYPMQIQPPPCPSETAQKETMTAKELKRHFGDDVEKEALEIINDTRYNEDTMPRLILLPDCGFKKSKKPKGPKKGDTKE